MDYPLEPYEVHHYTCHSCGMGAYTLKIEAALCCWNVKPEHLEMEIRATGHSGWEAFFTIKESPHLEEPISLGIPVQHYRDNDTYELDLDDAFIYYNDDPGGGQFARNLCTSGDLLEVAEEVFKEYHNG